MKIRLVVTALSVLVLCWPKTATAQCSMFGGRATVVQANGLGIVPVVLADTGNIDSGGGAKDASLLSALVGGLLSGETAHAAAIGKGSYSRSESSLANLTLTVAGNTIGAGFLEARANAYCGVGVTGDTEVDGLVVNGQAIAVTGAPNQIVSLAGGAMMILNEQTSSLQNGSMTVNAIHVTVPGITEVVIGSAFAAVGGQLVGTGGGSRRVVALLLQVVNGPCGTMGPPCLCPDFITGGGWIIPVTPPPNSTLLPDKANFAAAGGVNPSGKPLGHLEYVDHNTGMNVHGIDIPNCMVPLAFCPIPRQPEPPPTQPPPQGSFPATSTTRQLTGNARVRYKDGTETTAQYTVCMADNGEPGRNDTFYIALDTGYTSGAPQPLRGGNIQQHK